MVHTGQKRSEGAYSNNVKTGPWTTWHWNGRIESEGEYENDQKVGRWTRYDDQGEIVERKTFGAAKAH